MKRRLVFAFLLFSLGVARADDNVRSTQEELRRRNIYFGDIDGRRTGELQAALKRYQSRKGLAVTGQDDHDTLRSLGLASRGPNEPPPKELEMPDEPVLKSDTKIDVAAEAHAISAATGVSPASVDPDVVASGHQGTRRRASSEDDRSELGNTPASPASRFSAGKHGPVPAAIQHYVESYLNAVSRNRLQDELHFYADRVNYLGNGWIDRRIIEHSLRKYYARWPSRRYSHVERIGFRGVPSHGQIEVTFRVDFEFHNAHSKARGATDNVIVIDAATADPRIVSIEESRVRR